MGRPHGRLRTKSKLDLDLGAWRDPSEIAYRRESVLMAPLVASLLGVSSSFQTGSLVDLFDSRRFTPGGVPRSAGSPAPDPALEVVSAPRVRASYAASNFSKKANSRSTRAFVTFSYPGVARALICYRRSARRRALFSVGFRGGYRRKPRFTRSSRVFC